MAALRSEDGRTLDVVPVPVLDRTGRPYEMTLALTLDGAPFGTVGQRCGGVLSAVLAGLSDHGLPVGTIERGVRAWSRAGGTDDDAAWTALRPHLPHDVELFCLRTRDPDDETATGELRALVEQARHWEDGHGWRSRVAVVLQAWGASGSGVRVGLELPAFCTWLACLLQEWDAVGTPAPT